MFGQENVDELRHIPARWQGDFGSFAGACREHRYPGDLQIRHRARKRDRETFYSRPRGPGPRRPI